MLPYIEPKIRQTKVMAGDMAKWTKKDIIDRLTPMLKAGQLKLTGSGLIKRNAPADSIQWETPWWHTRHMKCQRCYQDHHIKFNHFNYIPPRCLECWKVVVMPRTLKELFKVRDFQAELDKPSKCGIELRDYVPRQYGAYWYNTSLDQGRERYEEVRKLVNKRISQHVKVILKRGCTEYELVKGDSTRWCIDDATLELDYEIENVLELDAQSVNISQGDLSKTRLKTLWMEFAHSRGDMTYKEFNGDLDLYRPSTTYHEGDVGEIKMNLAAQRAMMMHRHLPKKSAEVMGDLGELMQKHEIGPRALGVLMGNHGISPFNIHDHNELT